MAKVNYPRVVALPETEYGELMAIARWQNAQPGWLSLPESVHEALHDRWCQVLEDHLPEEVLVNSVESVNSAGLVLLAVVEDGGEDVDVRIRLRKSKS